MLQFVRHNYGFKIIHPEDGTIGGITYYNKYNLIGGLFRDYEVREIFEKIDKILDKARQDNPVTLKYVPSLYYTRKGVYKSLPIIHSLQNPKSILEKFKYATKPADGAAVRHSRYGINGASRNDY